MSETLINMISASPEETEQVGAALAQRIAEGKEELPRFIALYVDLGSGKTAFVRGFTSFISPRSAVRSPTFTIVNEYRGGKIPVFHFDMYRIDGEDDLYSIGLTTTWTRASAFPNGAKTSNLLFPKNTSDLRSRG